LSGGGFPGVPGVSESLMEPDDPTNRWWWLICVLGFRHKRGLSYMGTDQHGKSVIVWNCSRCRMYGAYRPPWNEQVRGILDLLDKAHPPDKRG
jgi:hypothetical protein